MQKERKDKNFIKQPVYPGGQKALREFIRQNLRYPEAALKQRIEGTVSMRYTIDHNGKVIDTHVIAGLGYGCDEEASRVVRQLKFDVPKTRGVKVQFHKDIHVHFRLPKQKSAPAQVAVTYSYHSPQQKDQSPAKSYSYTINIKPKSK